MLTVLHLGQERRSHDDVGAPARARKHHGSVRSNFHREKLRREPCRVAHPSGIESNVDDHTNENDISRPSNFACLECQIVVDWDPVEGNRCETQEKSHSPHCAQ